MPFSLRVAQLNAYLQLKELLSNIACEPFCRHLNGPIALFQVLQSWILLYLDGRNSMMYGSLFGPTNHMCVRVYANSYPVVAKCAVLGIANAAHMAFCALLLVNALFLLMVVHDFVLKTSAVFCYQPTKLMFHDNADIEKM